MKSFIFVLCFAFSAAVYAQEDSISVINSSAELACKNNPDAASKESCKELLLSTAAFASENAKFYSAFCRGHVKDEDKEKCDDAGKLVRYFQSLNQ